jgi:hypothetical protein
MRYGNSVAPLREVKWAYLGYARLNIFNQIL